MNHVKTTLVTALAGTIAAGCGDGAICPSEALVAISAPFDGATVTNADDLDLDADGVQIDVPVRTNLRPGAAVSLEILGDGDPAPDSALVTSVDAQGRAVFENVTLPFGSVGLRAMAVDDECGDSTDDLWINVTVVEPVSPPRPVNDIAAEAPLRNTIVATFAEPAENVAGFIIKIADEPLTETNFNSVGIELEAPPSPAGPGQTQTVEFTTLRVETAYYVGVATIDDEGTRSVASIAGPVVPVFDRILLTPPTDQVETEEFGYKVVSAFFNEDGFVDLAVTSPDSDAGGTTRGEVYIYYGSATGLATSPSVTLSGLVDGASFGNGLAAVDWNGDGLSDLAVGAPFENGNDGAVYIFDNADLATAGSVDSSAADVVIRPQDVGTNLFDGSFFGWAIESPRFDDDDRDDLVIGAPLAGGDGAVVILYGGNSTANIVVDDDDDGTLLGGVGRYVEAPSGAGNFFGTRVRNLGRTEASADATDDVVVSFFNFDTAYLLRGRAQPPSGFVNSPYDDASDLEFTALSNTASVGTASASVIDLDDDGVREVAFGAWREGADAGAVWVVSGDATGTVDSNDPEVLLSIAAGPGISFVGMELVWGDVDGDGLDDLVVVARRPSVPVLVAHIWFGDTLAPVSTTTDSADAVIVGSEAFTGFPPANGDRPGFAAWMGDVNGDGLGDLCWADYVGTGGAIEVLWDDGVAN